MILTCIIILLLIIACALMITNKNRELKSFDRSMTQPLRGLLALLIVFHHLSQRCSIPIICDFGKTIGTPIVAFFFLLSGYGLCTSYLCKGHSYLNNFFIKRYSKILPAFLLLTCVAIYIGSKCGKTPSFQLIQLILYGNTPLPFSWFIYVILYTYAAFYISAILGKTPQKIGLYLLVFNVIYIGLVCKLGHYGTWWFVSILSVNLGYYLAIYENSLTKLFCNHPIAIYSIAIVIILISFYCEENMLIFSNVPKVIGTGFWVLNIAGASYLIIRSLGMIQWNLLVWLSAISMEIYLIHGLPVEYLKNIEIFSGISDILYLFLTYTISIPAAWLIHHITAKIHNQVRNNRSINQSKPNNASSG